MKRLYIIVITLIATLTAMAVDIPGGTKLYLNTNDSKSIWDSGNNRFAAYFFNDATGKNSWVDAFRVNDDIYSVVAPEGTWEALIFCMMNKR